MAGTGSYLPLAALLVAVVLAATSAVPVAAAAAPADKYSGRMVIIRAPGARIVDVSAGGGALNKWQQQQRRRRLVEDEVAPEFGGLLGAGTGGHISAATSDKDRAICLPHAECAARGPGGSNTRPCKYKDHCAHTPTAAGHARAVHG